MTAPVLLCVGAVVLAVVVLGVLTSGHRCLGRAQRSWAAARRERQRRPHMT